MRPFFFLLLLQAGVCALLLLRGWERRSAGGGWLAGALASGVAFVAAAVGLLLSLSPRWFPGWYFIVGVIFMILGYLAHALMLRRQRERGHNPHGGPGILSEIIWQTHYIVGFAFLLMLCLNLARWFNAQYTVSPHALPIPAGMLAAAVTAGVLSGGLLMATVLRGALCNVGLYPSKRVLDGSGANPHMAQAHALNAARLILICVLYLRFVAILFSLWLWATYDVEAMRRFFEAGVEGVALFSMMRIFLGVLLPAFTVGTIGMAVADGGIRAARWYFVLTFIFILIGEVMGLALTAGLRGIAF